MKLGSALVHDTQSQRQTQGMKSIFVFEIMPISIFIGVPECLMCKLVEVRKVPYTRRRVGWGNCHRTLRRRSVQLTRADSR